MATIILTVAIALIVYGVLQKGEQKAIERQLQALPGFTPVVRFDRPKKFSLVLDPHSSQFAIASAKQPARVYGFHQVVAVEEESSGGATFDWSGAVWLCGARASGVVARPACFADRLEAGRGAS